MCIGVKNRYILDHQMCRIESRFFSSSFLSFSCSITRGSKTLNQDDLGELYLIPLIALQDWGYKANAKREVLLDRWVWVVEFHDPTLGIGKVFGQESTVVKWNYQILSLHLVTVCQKVPILDFQSEFSMSKIIWIFLKKNSLKNINLGAPFL